MRKYVYIIGILAVMLSTAGCKEVAEALPIGSDGEIKAGEPVLFTTHIPQAATRTAAEDAFIAKMEQYKEVSKDYTFTVEMYEKDAADTDVKIGQANYVPTKTTTTTGAGTAEETTTVSYAADGTLTPASAENRLYWPDNTKRYAFKAMAIGADISNTGATLGKEAIQKDQTTEEKLLQQDLLVGYGFEPEWNTTADAPKWNEGGLNYLTSKEWYAANQQTKGMAPGSEDAASWYKKIPLYMQHQRSLITIRLKAGEGVERSALAYSHAIGAEDAKGHISTTVYSYADGTTQEIQPWAKKSTVDYTSADFGTPANGVETTEYTCIVNPYEYLTNATSPIARINVSGQHFTFYATNDFLYNDSKDQNASNYTEAAAHMQGYNLTAGKHLVITATLGRGSRKILITAYVEDWTEAVTTSIVDDYGKSGEPIQINSRKELYEFLIDTKRNKPGNVAIIVPNSLDLEKSEGADLAWDYNGDGTEENDLDLWCTLNLAGATLRTNHQIFKNIHPMGNLVNGTITVGNATVPAAIAETSVGTVERVSVVPRDAVGNSSTGKASRAGLVISNSGTITQCSSELPVYGTYDNTTGSTKNLVGGIAAYSVYSTENGSTMPVIDGCTVNARVDGATGVRGAGIVGEAAGRVTNNTFVYGRTIMQDRDAFKNTIHHKVNGNDASPTLRAYGNAWPTKANANGAGIPTTNTNVSESTYNEVIDSQQELAFLLDPNNASYNQNGLKYRLSGDFTVTKLPTEENGNKGWTYGKQSDIVNVSGGGNVYFELDGNNHTITTDAMLFTNILNTVSNLTIRLGNDLIATSSTGGKPDGNEAIAPLAYAVCTSGENKGKISNIQVKGGDYYIQGPTAGGVVVWAYGGATVEDCQCKATIQVWIPGTGALTDSQRKYSGGIVATAAKATITRCVFHNDEKTLFRNTSDDYMQTTANYTDTSAGLYYGGILGGTRPKGESTPEQPSVLITDCTSWFNASGNEYKGAIVGYAQYLDGSTQTNGTVTGDSGCQGNWWNSSNKAVGTGVGTDEDIVGKRNAVTPMKNQNYEE